MKKNVSKFVQTDKGIMFLFIVIIFISTWAYMAYTKPIVTDLEYSYNGIKYDAGNLNYAEPVSIDISGIYTNTNSL